MSGMKAAWTNLSVSGQFGAKTNKAHAGKTIRCTNLYTISKSIRPPNYLTGLFFLHRFNQNDCKITAEFTVYTASVL